MKFSRNKGQSLVEAALVLPIIIVLLIGIIDFGLLFNNYLVLCNASREGARNAAVGASDAQIRSIVSTAASSLEQDELTITITPNESYRKNGDEIDVTLQYKNELFTPLSSIISEPINLSSTTIMRME